LTDAGSLGDLLTGNFGAGDGDLSPLGETGGRLRLLSTDCSTLSLLELPVKFSFLLSSIILFLLIFSVELELTALLLFFGTGTSGESAFSTSISGFEPFLRAP
jgi:hypothetical protein